MDYNIFYDDKTNLKYIKFGKTQSFNNKKYIPIYYNDENKKATKYNDFLIKIVFNYFITNLFIFI